MDRAMTSIKGLQNVGRHVAVRSTIAVLLRGDARGTEYRSAPLDERRVRTHRFPRVALEPAAMASGHALVRGRAPDRAGGVHRGTSRALARLAGVPPQYRHDERHGVVPDVQRRRSTCGGFLRGARLDRVRQPEAQLPAYRVLMVWVYDRTGSLLVAMLMHASLSASTFVLSPEKVSGLALVAYNFALGAAWWTVVAAIAIASRERISRQPLGVTPGSARPASPASVHRPWVGKRQTSTTKPRRTRARFPTERIAARTSCDTPR
jgi:hypothetical protein